MRVILTCFANEGFKALPSQVIRAGSHGWWIGNLETNMNFRVVTTWSHCFQQPFSCTYSHGATLWMFSLSSEEPRWLAPLIGKPQIIKSFQSSCCVPRPFLYSYFCEIGGRTFGKHLTTSSSSSGSALLTEQAGSSLWPLLWSSQQYFSAVSDGIWLGIVLCSGVSGYYPRPPQIGTVCP